MNALFDFNNCCCAGAIYDYRKSYDDVFYVVGALYVLDAIIFGLIPWMDTYRAKMGIKTGSYDEIHGAVDQHTETYRITKRSLSKSSLVNGEPDGGVGGTIEYGTMSAPNAEPPPPKPNHPDFSSQDVPTKPTNPFYRQDSYPPRPPPPTNPFTRQDSNPARPPPPNLASRNTPSYPTYGGYDQ